MRSTGADRLVGAKKARNGAGAPKLEVEIEEELTVNC
jgi:hypothetical protein